MNNVCDVETLSNKILCPDSGRVEMGRKDYLLQLCASNDIETSKKDTMATLTAKLESTGIPIDVPSGSLTI